MLEGQASNYLTCQGQIFFLLSFQGRVNKFRCKELVKGSYRVMFLGMFGLKI